MSFSRVLKSANRVLVYSHGLKSAHFPFQFFRLTSVMNYLKSVQKLGIQGLS
jgi:hypothetical protein